MSSDKKWVKDESSDLNCYAAAVYFIQVLRIAFMLLTCPKINPSSSNLAQQTEQAVAPKLEEQTPDEHTKRSGLMTAGQVK